MADQNSISPLAEGILPTSGGAALTLADLQGKLAHAFGEEEQLRLRFEYDLGLLKSRRQLLETVINGLREVYSIEQINAQQDSSNHNAYSTPASEIGLPNDFQVMAADKKAEDEQPLNTGDQYPDNKGTKPRARGVLRNAILNALKDLDRFASSREIVEHIQQHVTSELIPSKDLRTALKDARRQEAIIAFPYYDSNDVLTYISGLPAFMVEGSNNQEIKPQYSSQLEQLVSAFSLILKSDSGTLEQQKTASELDSPAVMPLATGDTVADTGELKVPVGHLQDYAAGVSKGLISRQESLPLG